MCLRDILNILPRDYLITVFDEQGNCRFKGHVYELLFNDDRYLLSCLVDNVFKENFYIKFIIIYF